MTYRYLTAWSKWVKRCFGYNTWTESSDTRPSLRHSSRLLFLCDFTSQISKMSGLFGSASSSASAANSTTGDISKDIALSNPPEDSISDISFSPQSEHLAVASWDKKVRIYEINAQGGSEGKALFEHEAPVLSCCWSKVPFRVLYTCRRPTDICGRTVLK